MCSEKPYLDLLRGGLRDPPPSEALRLNMLLAVLFPLTKHFGMLAQVHWDAIRGEDTHHSME